jgi:hypothetical protein
MKDKRSLIDSAMKKYDENKTILYRNSTITDQKAYQMTRGRVVAVSPRLLEIIKFSEIKDWKRLGVACMHDLM